MYQIWKKVKHILRKNMLERYMNCPDRNFKNRNFKYAALDNLCYAQFLANYYLDSKKIKEEENDSQPEVVEEIINDLSTLNQFH